MTRPLPTHITITMAGLGKRFRDAGIDVPKYMIKAGGRTLFEWSLASLSAYAGAGHPFTFVMRGADQAEAFVAESAAAFGIARHDIVTLDRPTDGQATSALLGTARVPRDAPIAVFNIDTFVDPEHLQPALEAGEGWIPCFQPSGDGWSFVRTDPVTGSAAEVREKVRISPHATVGFYWFASASLFADCYHRYYGTKAGREENGERYVAPLYNQLIGDGGTIKITHIPLTAVTPLGTPAELESFLRRGER